MSLRSLPPAWFTCLLAGASVPRAPGEGFLYVFVQSLSWCTLRGVPGKDLFVFVLSISGCS